MTRTQIKALRKKTGLNQQGFASLIGVSTVTVNRWERGHMVPSADSAGFLALLGKAIEQLPVAEVLQRLRAAGNDRVAVYRVLFEIETKGAVEAPHAK